MFLMQDCKAMDRLMQHIITFLEEIGQTSFKCSRLFSNYLIIFQHFFSNPNHNKSRQREQRLNLKFENSIGEYHIQFVPISCRKVFHGFNLLHKNRKLFVFLSNITVRTSLSLISDRALHIFHFPGLQLQVSLTLGQNIDLTFHLIRARFPDLQALYWFNN